MVTQFLRSLARGLSPPTRGSRRVPERTRRQAGSIPAHTGKPGAALCGMCPWEVYPRPHGEALPEGASAFQVTGLSPPTRGSLHPQQRAGADRGSIPAHTGKPRCRWSRGRMRRVYPRPHGEAAQRALAWLARHGLSPPTRGSPRHLGRRSLLLGSIPAHTGKPSRVAARASAARVYPRPHGEALTKSISVQLSDGLSPPTRGSHPASLIGETVTGSIPAHTGKPSTRPDGRAAGPVYPRPHGEARAIRATK